MTLSPFRQEVVATGQLSPTQATLNTLATPRYVADSTWLGEDKVLRLPSIPWPPPGNWLPQSPSHKLAWGRQGIEASLNTLATPSLTKVPLTSCPPPAPTLAPAWPPSPVSSTLPVSFLPSPATQHAGECVLLLSFCHLMFDAESEELSFIYFLFQDLLKAFSPLSPHLILSTLSILSQRLMSEEAEQTFLNQ